VNFSVALAWRLEAELTKVLPFAQCAPSSMY
jgi:hypothetical protein